MGNIPSSEQNSSIGSVPTTPQTNSSVNQVNPLPVIQQPLPQGWEMRTDKYGRAYYLNHILRRTTFVDPRVPVGWEMQLDQQGRPYFIDHVNKATTWQDPRLLPGWEMQVDSQGRPYFIDHVNKRTTYADPRTISEAPILPPGWEMRFDPAGKPVYIDHSSHPKRTTYERPQLQDEKAKEAESPVYEKSKESEEEPPSHNDATTPATDDDKTCVICLENERCVALIPRGHLCLCRGCSATQTKCPVCRTPIKDLLRTFSV